jgi:hypothetical protein
LPARHITRQPRRNIPPGTGPRRMHPQIERVLFPDQPTRPAGITSPSRRLRGGVTTQCQQPTQIQAQRSGQGSQRLRRWQLVRRVQSLPITTLCPRILCRARTRVTARTTRRYANTWPTIAASRPSHRRRPCSTAGSVHVRRLTATVPGSGKHRWPYSGRECHFDGQPALGAVIVASWVSAMARTMGRQRPSPVSRWVKLPSAPSASCKPSSVRASDPPDARPDGGAGATGVVQSCTMSA